MCFSSGVLVWLCCSALVCWLLGELVCLSVCVFWLCVCVLVVVMGGDCSLSFVLCSSLFVVRCLLCVVCFSLCSVRSLVLVFSCWMSVVFSSLLV